MKILVTGGAGFIGSNFIYYMLNKYDDYEIVCLDKLTYAGNIITLATALKNSRFKFIKGDIADRKLVYDLFEKEKFDIVVNFAAESHVDRSVTNPEIFLVTNVLGTQVLLDASNKYGVLRFHQISTDEVYGDLPIERKDLYFTENSLIHTSSPYSASKASADLLVQAYYRTYGTPITISRCSNNYGAFQFPEKLIPLMIIKALNKGKLPVYGNGLNVRDWLYVIDHCKAIDLIIHSDKVGEVYNIGGHNEKSNIEVVKTILNKLNCDESLIEYVSDRPGHDRRYAINPEKICNEFGWNPTIKFDEGISNTIQWYLNNKKWWMDLIEK
ncbi:dTDP-glucose 4,6-dehydratase [Sedimentibacter sp. zth1]|uniref:dTDP-glucose 4,6-dehydratase n=1 Tax=Sedimentibacter sp. zth1 TaxID=2816908 RepID=UPI001A93A2EF|nr:dTDP-glucose 4,6-dehydratase [Sedimentibacter sp. zth1]QSX07157.1 dTDP-glucose 4,6-dehydratase [Sedimentibacter sp. zth1]